MDPNLGDLSRSRSLRLFVQQEADEVLLKVSGPSDLWDRRTDRTLVVPQSLCLPTPIVLQFLQRLRWEEVEVIAIIPYWPNRPWFPLLTLLSFRELVPLPLKMDLLSQGTILHPCPAHLQLRAWFLRGGEVGGIRLPRRGHSHTPECKKKH